MLCGQPLTAKPQIRSVKVLTRPPDSAAEIGVRMIVSKSLEEIAELRPAITLAAGTVQSSSRFGSARNERSNESRSIRDRAMQKVNE